MLPFLKPKRATTLIMAIKKPGDTPEMQAPESETHKDLVLVAADAISAIHANDARALAAAFEAAFYICQEYSESGEETK